MKIPPGLIGTDYEQKDCWAVVKEFYSYNYDIELNDYYDGLPKEKYAANQLITSAKRDFELVKGYPVEGDILLIRLFGVECHIAVYLGRGQILHTKQGTGCMIDRYSKWEKSVSGIYRVKND